MADLRAEVDAVRAIPAVPTILDVLCRSTGMGFATVARVTAERWVACEVLDRIDFGLAPGDELRIETTICRDVRACGAAVVINHVAEDPAWRDHPTPAMYGFQSYISMPIVLRDGSLFGTLCAIDPRPARLAPEAVEMFRLFAELIAMHLDARRSLLDERETSELRDQFIAVLGHDLRNPLAAIDAGVRLLQRRPRPEVAAEAIRLMHGSVRRMAGLIDNLMDFARGRLGGGMPLQPQDGPLEPVLAQVVAELRSAHPERAIETAFALDRPFRGDQQRIGQLFSNLLANALQHGAPGQPVRVTASTAAGLELSVANAGPPIPPEAQERLFRPFTRGAQRGAPQGLGLGLFIARRIAEAHGGTLEARSTPAETRFTLRIPEPG